MDRKQDVKNKIMDLFIALRTSLFIRDAARNCGRLIFLKYIVDNNIKASQPEDFRMYMRVQKLFAQRNISDGLADLISLLKFIDVQYGLNDVISNASNVDAFASILFGEVNFRQKRNLDESLPEKVIQILRGIDLEEEKENSHDLGKDVVNTLFEIINNYSADWTNSEFTTDEIISQIAKRILNVQSDDTFVDIAGGIGKSMVAIAGDTLPEVRIADINDNNISYATMMLIMYGFKDIKADVVDSFSGEFNYSGNKLFSDVPVGMRLEDKGYLYRDSNLMALTLVVDKYLAEKEGSIAVLTVPGNTLFGSSSAHKKVKAKLLNNYLIKAVVALPPLWGRSSVPTNLIVLSREHNQRIIMIDANSIIKKTKNGFIGVDEAKEKIVQRIKGYTDEVEFSKVVWNSEMFRQDMNLSPSLYIEHIVQGDDTRLEDINAELDDLYSKLLELSKQ